MCRSRAYYSSFDPCAARTKFYIWEGGGGVACTMFSLVSYRARTVGKGKPPCDARQPSENAYVRAGDGWFTPQAIAFFMLSLLGLIHGARA